MPKIKNDLTDVEQHIVLMTLYRDEWKYRNEWFMSVFWRFVYLSLIITFLPNFLVAVNTESKLVSTLPIWVHSIAGIICALFGLYIGITESKKITYIDLAYRRIEKDLPLEYQIKKIDNLPVKLRNNNILCITIYTVIILLSITNMVNEYLL
jgi:hypothetical protein